MLFYLFIELLFIFPNLGDELPSFIHVCHKEDPNLEQCLMASVEDIRPFLVEGVPEYKIPSLEPLVMKDFFSEDIAGMKITVYNVSAWGCTDFFVREINVNLDTHNFILYVDIPKLRIEAHYSVDGKLLLVPVKGSGNLEANMTNCKSKAELNGEIYENNGDQYLKYTTFDLHVDVGEGHVLLENLFNGDKILRGPELCTVSYRGDRTSKLNNKGVTTPATNLDLKVGMINDVVNKNLDMFLKELMPVVERSLASVFLDTANVIVESFTYKQLFPH